MEKGQASNTIVKEWQWQTDSDNESLGYMACHSLAAGPKILCRWWGDNSETPNEAALLEAAPELLGALQRIANSCQAMLGGDDCDPYDMAEAILRGAQEAIAKATGGAL